MTPLQDASLAVVIDVDERDAALGDPKVHATWARARAFTDSLVARGHCQCHLVVNCPSADNQS